MIWSFLIWLPIISESDRVFFLLCLHHHHHHYWADIIMFLYCAAIEQTNYSFIHSFIFQLNCPFCIAASFRCAQKFLHTESLSNSNQIDIQTNKQLSLCIVYKCILSAYSSVFFFFISSFIALFSIISRTL